MNQGMKSLWKHKGGNGFLCPEEFGEASMWGDLCAGPGKPGGIIQASRRDTPDREEDTECTSSRTCGGMHDIWGLLSQLNEWLEPEG